MLRQPRVLLAGSLGIVLAALAIGLPTAVIPNPWFARMVPAGPANYFFWVASSLLTGALLATYALPRSTRDHIAAATAGSGYLGLLAVGCPVCNKLVVALLGVSGAFTYFAPIQPLLGAGGLLLAAVALAVRVRGAARSCALPQSPSESDSRADGSGRARTGPLSATSSPTLRRAIAGEIEAEDMGARTSSEARSPVSNPVQAVLHSPPAIYLGGTLIGALGSVLALLAIGAL